ncbi:MAG: hypothetical protein Q9164_007129 [Protoblastenia rupestris]
MPRRSSSSNGAGDTQDNSLMLDDDGVIADAIDALNKAIHTEPDSKATHLVSSYPKELSKTTTLGRSDASSILEPAIELLDQLTASSADLPLSLCGKIISDDRHSPAAVVNPPRTVTPTPLQSHAQITALEKDKWKIRKIIGKRRMEKSYVYRVRWKDIWLLRGQRCPLILESIKTLHTGMRTGSLY